MILSHPLRAQKMQYSIIDGDSKEPLSYATITALSDSSTVLGGTITDAEGSFELIISKNIRKLEVAHLGYATLILTAPFPKKGTVIELDIDGELLSEIVVEGEKTSREFLIDRKVINFGNDLQSAGGTVLEAFEQLPEIETDPVTQTISLRGNSNVRILVNGKPSSLNNADLLDQIDASQVDKVEIITSPSAKYQADGASGIVNIILKDKVIKGLAGNINVEGRSIPRYGASGNLTSGFRNFNLQASAGYRYNLFINRAYNNRVLKTTGSFQEVSTRREFDGTVKNISLKADWFINSKNDFSLSFNSSENEHFITPVTTIANVNNGAQIVNKLTNFHSHRTKVYNVNYRKRFTDENKRYIDFDVTLTDNQNTLPSSAVVNDLVVLDNELFYDNSILNIASDVFWTFSEKSILETGVLYTMKTINNLQQTESNGDTDILAYKYDESNYSVYALLKNQYDKLGIQFGLRSEYFVSDGIVNNETEAVEREFWNLFPSLHLSYNKSDKLNCSLSYNRRISRPSFYSLNPLTTINDPLYRREGNPSLTPEFTDNFELGIRYNNQSFSVNNNLYYRKTSDIINRIFLIEDDITIMQFENGGENHTVGIESTVAQDITEQISLSVTATGYYQHANPDINDFYFEDQYNYGLQNKLSYTVSQKLSADIQWNYFGRRRGLNTRADDFNVLNLAARYKVLNNNGTLSLRFTDVFRGTIYENERISNMIMEDRKWLGQTRAIVMSFSYRFSQGDVKLRKQNKKNYNESGALE